MIFFFARSWKKRGFFLRWKRTSWSFGLLQTTTSCNILIGCNVWIIDRKKYTDMRILNLKAWSNNLQPSWFHFLGPLRSDNFPGVPMSTWALGSRGHRSYRLGSHQCSFGDPSSCTNCSEIRFVHKHRHTGIHGLHVKDSSHRASKMIMGKAVRLIPTYYCTMLLCSIFLPSSCHRTSLLQFSSSFPGHTSWVFTGNLFLTSKSMTHVTTSYAAKKYQVLTTNKVPGGFGTEI